MTRIIDAHHHVWDIARYPQTWMSPAQRQVIGRDRLLADYEAEAAAAGVSGSVLVQTVRDPRETPEFLALAADSPLVLGVVGWVDLDAGPQQVAAQVEALRVLPGAERLVGVRDQSADRPDPAWALSPEAGALFAACGAADLVVDLLLRPDQVPAATVAVERHPETRFVLDHLGNVDLDTTSTDAWGASLERLAASSHVGVKLSAVAARAVDPDDVRRRLPGVVATAVELFGAGRVLFGSDWPVSQMSLSYAEVVEVTSLALEELGDDDRRAVWADTATAWYGLDR
ncbi:amidohydrolase family protein [Nocardioides kribbensis]|uniref:amidohydrolase family protein n=1 Tax=Nocardioides kribbensis TaxID=305517 RepID=UPI0018799E25|nr:amidohydrolase family protein [Nocardioides kribbensis]